MQRPRGTLVVVGLGCALLLGATIHHGTEIDSVGGSVGPLLALILDGGIAIAVIYAGRRLSRSGFSVTEEWRVAQWSCVGSVTAVAAIGATLLVRALEGRSLVEPTFPLLVAAGAGALAGAVAGYYEVRQAVETRRARDAMRAVSVVNHLLRHDLRNDLSTIRGYADLVKDDATDDANDDANDRDPSAVIARKAEEGLDRIETSSAVADALLDQSEFHRVDLADATREVTAGFADMDGVTVETDIADAVPITANDGVRSIVDNLVENAIEHSGGEVTVRVAVRTDDETVTLSVADDGPGIPPERRDSLFDRDGTDVLGGLGLVETLVDGYGGSVSVAAAADLGGTRFEVTLPRPE